MFKWVPGILVLTGETNTVHVSLNGRVSGRALSANPEIRHNFLWNTSCEDLLALIHRHPQVA